MLPDAINQDLLYVSNFADGKVAIYEYPAGKLVGRLGGFGYPAGLCVDALQNVYVTEEDAPLAGSAILEYPHGALNPIKIFSDFYGTPNGCAIDPTTGNLAVANSFGPVSSGANVAIYGAAEVSAIYPLPAIDIAEFCGYDPAGNLYVDGQPDRFTGLILDELPKSSTNVDTITFDRAIGAPDAWPGAIQWQRSYFAIGSSDDSDAHEPAIYQVRIKDFRGSVVGKTVLGGSTDPHGGQFWIQGKTVIAPSYHNFHVFVDSRLRFYNYPDGGAPTKTLSRHFAMPYGVAISIATANARRK